MNKKKLLECVLPSARSTVILLGLHTPGSQETLCAQGHFLNSMYCVTKKTKLKGYAAIYVICLDEQPVGSVVAVEIAHDLYHMVGMYLKEDFRSVNICRTLNIEESSYKKSQLSISRVLLESVVKDIISNNQQMTLEALNNNKGAWMLYENSFSIKQGNQLKTGFKLMDKEEIVAYAQFRDKKIKDWHVINHEDVEQWGVQWEGVPNFNNSTRWSINRIYLLTPNNREFHYVKEKKINLSRKLSIALNLLTSLRWINYFFYIAHDKIANRLHHQSI